MGDPGYVLMSFLVMAAATFPARLFPFLVPRRYRTNEHLRFIGATLPAAVMLLLVIYCLKGARFLAPPYAIPELLSVAVVILVHLWKRHGLLSIGLGTACYILFVQTQAWERLFSR